MQAHLRHVGQGMHTTVSAGKIAVTENLEDYGIRE
jgi:hypothetical protein